MVTTDDEILAVEAVCEGLDSNAFTIAFSVSGGAAISNAVPSRDTCREASVIRISYIADLFGADSAVIPWSTLHTHFARFACLTSVELRPPVFLDDEQYAEVTQSIRRFLPYPYLAPPTRLNSSKNSLYPLARG